MSQYAADVPKAKQSSESKILTDCYCHNGTLIYVA